MTQIINVEKERPRNPHGQIPSLQFMSVTISLEL